MMEFLSKDEVISDAPPSFKASVWKKFGFVGKEKDGVIVTERTRCVCRLCNVKLKYSGNTTNLTTHLQRKHSMGAEPMSSSSKGKSDNSAKSSQSQPTLVSMMGSVHRFSKELNKKEKEEITKAVSEFIVKDMRPFSVVENCGFRHLIKVLEPRYTLPSRQFFADRLIPELYETVKNELLNDLAYVPGVGLTSDGWTSRSTESYETITCHFLDGDWKMQSRVLQTRTLNKSHTAENLCENLLEAITEWKLEGKVQGIVTDNAANMTLAVKKTGLINVRCFAHSLNLASQKSLTVPVVSKLLAKIRKVVTFFHKSSTATAVLKEKQTLLSLPLHKLKIDVQTRWNSSYDMIERYLEQQSAVQATLLSKEIRKNISDFASLSDTDFVLAEDFMKIMKPMKQATVMMCEESVPTVSIVLPLHDQLIRNFQPTDDDTKAVLDIKQAIRENLSLRYRPENNDKDFLLKAAALDPRFKMLPFLESIERHRVFGLLEKEASSVLSSYDVKQESGNVSNTPSLPEPPADEPECSTSTNVGDKTPDVQVMTVSPQKKKPRSAMSDLFDADVYVVKEVSGNKSLIERAFDEVVNYKKQTPLSFDDDPLNWWKTNEFYFPLLATIAKKFLCVPGTSVPLRESFSLLQVTL